jgi:tRNA pseudouridine38-40 synthase
VGAGRTDAGVHALRMTASFTTRSALPAAQILRALDAILPEDVGVLDVRDAPPGFHARRDAQWKWYRYTWLRSRLRRVHERRTSWRVGAPLDAAAMRAAADLLRGRRDFACFQSSGSPRRSTVRTLGGLRLDEDGPRLCLDAVADGFLYGMVRAIAGTLTEVGRGARPVGDLPALLDGRDRRRAGPAAPAHGLALVAVGYAPERAPAFVDPSLRTDLESPRIRRPEPNPPTEA